MHEDGITPRVICTKKCHGVASRALTTRQKNGNVDDNASNNNKNNLVENKINWNVDGLNGNYESSSEKTLLTRLLAEGNYSKYRGCKNNGNTKKHYHKMISQAIMQAGCTVYRGPNHVHQKISHLRNCSARPMTLPLQPRVLV
jgi:hypothetical protein